MYVLSTLKEDAKMQRRSPANELLPLPCKNRHNNTKERRRSVGPQAQFDTVPHKLFCAGLPLRGPQAAASQASPLGPVKMTKAAGRNTAGAIGLFVMELTRMRV